MRQIIAVKIISFLLLSVGVVGSASAASSTNGYASAISGSDRHLLDPLKVTIVGLQSETFYTSNGAAVSSLSDVYSAAAATDSFSSISSRPSFGLPGSTDELSTPGKLLSSNHFSSFTNYSSDTNVKPRGVTSAYVNSSGERVSFLGLWANASTFDGLLAALARNDFRDGRYIQAITRQGVLDSYASRLNPVPLPAAAWLFASALFGFVVVANRRKV